MKTIKQCIIALTCLVMPASYAAAAKIAKDFVITNRETGKPIRRDDFKGKILFLDFFAYWCPPCQATSPMVEKEIAEYYKTKGGNLHGVEVEVIGVNIESRSPTLTDKFIDKVGLETVANDYNAPDGAWAQFNKRFIPHFVIINGTEGSSFSQWEVLYSASEFKGASFFRKLIDSIDPKSTGPEISVNEPAKNQLVDGKATKSFGTVAVNKRGVSKSFTIKNLGDADLSGLKVEKSGANQGDFMVSKVTKSIVKPGEKATFKVVFKPTAQGVRQVGIRIMSNDSDENPFDINLTGKGSN